MSEKPEAPEKKAKTNSHIPETEDLPAPLGPQQATSRKRKAERAVDREPPVHARHHPVHAEPMTREERPSDHAWHTVLNSDPLVDSDEECPDEHLRVDYNRRMQVINRLRGRPPTPELEPTQATNTITLDTRRPGASRRRPSAA
ncbi:hypothetical protein PAXINDRAFT_152031 [Paxillus involutus ATCC 200175]|nr:hypothetical protein PAXINDRAFT_152031 [Paxillus involutus ATCC 200175]